MKKAIHYITHQHEDIQYITHQHEEGFFNFAQPSQPEFSKKTIYFYKKHGFWGGEIWKSFNVIKILRFSFITKYKIYVTYFNVKVKSL